MEEKAREKAKKIGRLLTNSFNGSHAVEIVSIAPAAGYDASVYKNKFCSPFVDKANGCDEVCTSTWGAFESTDGVARLYVDWSNGNWVLIVGAALELLGRDGRADYAFLRHAPRMLSTEMSGKRHARGRGYVHNVGVRWRCEERTEQTGLPKLGPTAMLPSCDTREYLSFVGNLRPLCDDVQSVASMFIPQEIEESKVSLSSALKDKHNLAITTAYASVAIGGGARNKERGSVGGGYACHTDEDDANTGTFSAFGKDGGCIAFPQYERVAKLRGLKGDVLLFPTTMEHGNEVHPDTPYNPAPKNMQRITISMYTNKRQEKKFDKAAGEGSCKVNKTVAPRAADLAAVLDSLIKIGGADAKTKIEQSRAAATSTQQSDQKCETRTVPDGLNGDADSFQDKDELAVGGAKVVQLRPSTPPGSLQTKWGSLKEVLMPSLSVKPRQVKGQRYGVGAEVLVEYMDDEGISKRYHGVVTWYTLGGTYRVSFLDSDECLGGLDEGQLSEAPGPARFQLHYPSSPRIGQDKGQRNRESPQKGKRAISFGSAAATARRFRARVEAEKAPKPAGRTPKEPEVFPAAMGSVDKAIDKEKGATPRDIAHVFWTCPL